LEEKCERGSVLFIYAFLTIIIDCACRWERDIEGRFDEGLSLLLLNDKMVKGDDFFVFFMLWSHSTAAA
jgi:hypothetical protein